MTSADATIASLRSARRLRAPKRRVFRTWFASRASTASSPKRLSHALLQGTAALLSKSFRAEYGEEMYSVYAHRGVSAMGAALEVLRNACVEGSEPTEVQMRDAMLYTMNHPPGIKVSDPVTIRFFKKETC